jgi:DNA polymerase-3 subunit gamma/tau
MAPTVNANHWSEIITALNLTGRSRELANNCVLSSIDDHTCHLLIDPSFQQVGNIAQDKLKAALQNHFQRPLKLLITHQESPQLTPAIEIQKAREDKQQAAVESIDEDTNVQELRSAFGARIIPGSIEPLN